MYLTGPQWASFAKANTSTQHYTPLGRTTSARTAGMHAWCVRIPWSLQGGVTPVGVDTVNAQPRVYSVHWYVTCTPSSSHTS